MFSVTYATPATKILVEVNNWSHEPGQNWSRESCQLQFSYSCRQDILDALAPPTFFNRTTRVKRRAKLRFLPIPLHIEPGVHPCRNPFCSLQSKKKFTYTIFHTS